MELQSPNSTSNNSRNPINDLPKHARLGKEKEKEKEKEQEHHFFEDIDSTCSTPYVSAPSSPGRGSGPVNGGFYYSAPASPMHFALTASYSYPVLSSSSSSPDNNNNNNNNNGSSGGSVALGFEFGSGSGSTGSMSSADELFLNGKIRPMKLSSHLERPQVLAPLLDLDEEEECNVEVSNGSSRGRDLRVVRDKSMRRRTRSLSPLRSASYDDDDDDDNVKQLKSASCLDKDNDQKNGGKNEQSSSGLEATTAAAAAASLSASSSRSSSAGRSSKRWVFLKDFLHRSKSEGRSTNKFWSTISFSPVLKEKKSSNSTTTTTTTTSLQASKDHQKDITNQGSEHQNSNTNNNKSKGSAKKPVNGIGKRRMPPSPHELHYTANRAQAEEMRKKTFLPYRQGLLGCLGFSSKGYGAMNGIARALNPVSSR